MSLRTRILRIISFVLFFIFFDVFYFTPFFAFSKTVTLCSFFSTNVTHQNHSFFTTLLFPSAMASSPASPVLQQAISPLSASGWAYYALITSLLIALCILFVYFKSKKMKCILHERTQEMQLSSQAKSDFLSHMSHEIRTPLNAIIGMAHISNNIIDTNPNKCKENIQEIIEASNHLLNVLNEILDMSKIESGKFEIGQEPFILNQQIRTVESIIRQRCLDKDIHLQTQYEGLDGLVVMGDPLRLNQVLINLLSNAVKFTADHGTVRLKVCALQRTNISANISFSVEDNGIGMTAQQIEKLFIPFEQANRNIASRFGGTGLGLAISQNLIQQMGGFIEVESQIEQGSSFRFDLSLPVAKMLPTARNTETTTAPNLTGKRILIVEDIEINRAILVELLKETNVILEEASNGLKAVEKMEASPEGYYDLIFMDIQMPLMGGYEASMRIRALPRSDAKTIPIIAMTANAYNEDIAKSLESGMNGHLSKPIDIHKMWSLLSKMLIKKAA